MIAFLIALAALWHATPAAAQEVTRNLVTNYGQSGSDISLDNRNILVQPFTTGANSLGYELSRVRVTVDRVSSAANAAVEIRELGPEGTDSNNRPSPSFVGNAVTLTNPSDTTSIQTNADLWFTAAAGTVLKPNTTYAVVTRDNRESAVNFDFAFTAKVVDNNLGETGAPGWEIADYVYLSSSNSAALFRPDFSARPRIVRLAIEGFAIVKPQISGTAQAGQTLEVSTGDFTFRNALGNVTFSYQWYRVAADDTAAEILGATGKSYTLVAADAGNTIRARVQFMDAAGVIRSLETDTYPSVGTVQAMMTGCAAPPLTGRTQIWSGSLTIGTIRNAVDSITAYGWSGAQGSLNPTSFAFRDEIYTIDGVTRVLAPAPNGELLFSLTAALSDMARSALVLHICDRAYPLASDEADYDAAGNDYRWSGMDLDWSAITGRTLYLSADNTRPTLVSAEVTGGTLVLTYSESLDLNSIPGGGAFSISINGTSTSAQEASVSGNTVTLSLRAQARFGETVTVSYTVPTDNLIRDASGNEAPPLTSTRVTNNSPDTDTTLSALTVRDGNGNSIEFTPMFSSASIQYGARVSHAVASVTVEATASDAANATVTILPGGLPVPLVAGRTLNEITVTVSNGSAQSIYTVSLFRPPTNLCDRSEYARADILNALAEAYIAGIRPQVDALAERIPGLDVCDWITADDLAQITSLHPVGSGDTLYGANAGDYHGLSGLTFMKFSGLVDRTFNGSVLPPFNLLILDVGLFSEAGLDSLNSISMDSVGLTKITSDALLNLPRLSSLDVRGSPHLKIKPGAFRTNTSLTNIYLGYNLIGHLESGLFDGLTNLSSLFLQGNSLGILPENIFQDLTSLTQLEVDEGKTDDLTPVVDAGDDQNAAPGETVTLEAAVSGTWGTNVRYTWTQVDGNDDPVEPPTVTLSDTEIASPSFTAPSLGEILRFKLRVEAPVGARLLGNRDGQSGLVEVATNQRFPSEDFVEVEITRDDDAPSVVISDVPANSNQPFVVTFTFSEAMTGFTEEDITVGNGTVSEFTNTETGTTWTAKITPTVDGEVTVDVAADVAMDGDGNGNTAARQAMSTFATPNAAPVFDDDALTRSFAENAGPGTDVGDPVPMATDSDNDALTYKLLGLDEASFDFDGSTRQITTKVGVDYDFEAQPSYTVNVKAIDENGAIAKVTVTINLMDVDEPPMVPDAPTVTATSGTTTSLDVSWTAPANDGRPHITSYDLRYCAGAPSDCMTDADFTNGPPDRTGLSASIPGLLEGTRYQVQVRASNDEGDSGWSESGDGSTATPVNTAPTAADGEVTIDEDTVYTFTAADFNFEDVDSGDTLDNVRIVTLPDADRGTLQLQDAAVNENQAIPLTEIGQGFLTYSPPANANGTGYASFTFRVSDGSAESDPATVMTINVTPVPDAPELTNPISDQTAMVGESFSFTIPGDAFTEVDGDALDYDVRLSNGDPLPDWLVFDVATQTFTGTPGAGDAGNLTIKVAINEVDGEVSDEFDIVVSPPPDTTAPTILSIERLDPAESLTNAVRLAWRITFSEPVRNVNQSTIVISGLTNPMLELTKVGEEDRIWEVTASGGNIADVDGEILLSFAATFASKIEDMAGNELNREANPVPNENSYQLDRNAPTVAFIQRLVPTGISTNADQVVWLVRFSEEVKNVDAADFQVSGTSATLAVNRERGTSDATWEVRASGGDLADYNGTVRLSFASDQNIQDRAGNALSNTAPTTNLIETIFELDNLPPTVAIQNVPGTSQGPFTATIRFSEAVQDFFREDIVANNATLSAFTATVADQEWTVQVTPTTDGEVTLDIAADVARDGTGNGNTAATQASSDYTAPAVDTTAPGVVSIERQDPAAILTNADSLTWRVIFTEVVMALEAEDFTLDGTTAELAVEVIPNPGGWDITASGGNLATLDGRVTLAFASDQNITDLAGLALQDLQPTGANEISYDLDNTAPMVTWTLPTALEIDLDFLLFRPQTTDTDIISYRATDLPAGLTVNERTGVISGTLTTVSDAITSTVTVTDEAGNMASTVLEFPAIAADTTPPRVTSIQRRIPASSPTSNPSTLNWSVEFSVAVDNVDRSDFTVQPTPGTLLVDTASGSNGRIFTVTAFGSYRNTDLTATLEFASDQDITDRAGNLLTDTVPTGANDNFFVIDNTRPAVEITDVPPQSDAPFTATITFSETVTGFVQEDITAGNATLSDFTAVDTAETPAGTTWTVRVTPDADGSVTLDIAANVAVDQVNQGNTAATQATSAYSSLFQVRGVTLTPQIHELEVRWEVATGAAGYIVQWKSGTQDYDSAREWRTTDPTITRRDLAQLDGNTEYTVRVIPFTGSSPNQVLGVPSAEVMATPLKPTPVILFTDDGGGEPITQDINGLVAARIQFFQSAQGIEVEDFVVTNGELVPGSLNFVRGNTRNVTINVVVTAQEGELFTFTVLEDVIENGNHAATFSQAAGRPLTATITTNARQPVTSNFSTTFTFSENVRGEGGSVEPIDGLFIPESAVPGSNLASFNCCTYTNVSYVSRGAVTIDGQRTFTVNFRPRGNFEGEGRIYLIPGRVQDDATKSIRNLPAELRVQIDTKSPELQSMAVEGTGIVFTFHEDLDPGSVPAADAFTVTVDGAAASLAATDPVLVSGPTLTLTLAERVVGGQVLRVRYAKGSRPLQDLPSNDVANFTRQVTVPPVLAVASTPMLLSLGTAEADTYGEGEAIQVTATFAETVAVTGTPAISLDIGGTTRTVTYESGTGTDTLRFSSTVTASDLDADGISWQANALALAGGAITGEDGQAVDIAHVLQGALAAHKVDGSQQGGATITDIRMSSTPVADAIYRADEVIRFTADFSGPVLVSGVPTLAFTLGDTVQQATAVDVSEVAVDELTFIYTVTASDQDLDGISWEADPITLPDDATIIGPDITAPADLSYQARGPLSEHTVRGGNVLATGAPTITGTAQSGQTLTAGQGDLADPDDLPTTFPDDYTFQWVRENEDGTGTEDITGATSATYLLNTDDVGRKVWVRVTFTDGQGNTETRESARFPVAGTVVAVNSAPTVANQIPNQSATVGTAFSFTIPANTFDDADGDPLDYAATLADSNPLPAWLDFDPATREFSGTPTTAETITVRVSVTDAEDESASEDFDIVVSPAVDTAAPSFDSATVDGTTMTITFDEALDDTSTPAADAFTVLADATAVMVSTAAVSGSTVTLTLATAVTAGQTVTVAYTKPDTGSVLQDASSNETATFAARTVENATAAATPPPSTGNTLVGNSRYDGDYITFEGGRYFAQAFTAAERFSLNAIELYFISLPQEPRRAAQLTVSVHQLHESFNNRPGNKLFDLTSPMAIRSTTEAQVFTAPSGTVLDAGAYWVQIYREIGKPDEIQLQPGTNEETSDSLTDWNIFNSSLNGSTGTNWSQQVVPFRMVLKGMVATPQPNADLTELILLRTDVSSNITLSPEFDPETTDYTANASTAARVTLRPTVATDATVAYQDGAGNTLADADDDSSNDHQVDLDLGENVIKIVVTAGDGMTTREYTVTVTREPNATVTDVVVSSTPVRWAEVIGPNIRSVYGAGEVIEFTVTFSGGVDLDITGGRPTLAFLMGDRGITPEIKNATFSRDTGTPGSIVTGLVFAYTVQPSDSDNNGIFLPIDDAVPGGVLQLNGATLDYYVSGGLLSTAITSSRRTQENHRVDGRRSGPYILSLEETSTPGITRSGETEPDTYGAGETIAFTLTLSEAVTVTGTPHLSFMLDSLDRSAEYTSGSGTDELVFTYTVQSGDDGALIIADGQSIVGNDSAVLLEAGESIVAVSDSTKNADLVNPNRGLTGSQVDGSMSVFDTTAPAVQSIVRQNPVDSPTNANTLTWRVTFSEDVANVDSTDFTLSGTTATLTVAEATAATVYDVTVSGGDLASLDGTVTLGFAASQDITDTADTPNALSNTTPTGPNDNSYVLDNTAPTVTITGVPGTSSAPFEATIEFSEAVTDFMLEDITAENATLSGFTESPPGNGMVWTVQVAPTADGEMTLDIAANAAEDEAGNGNGAATQASSTFTAPAVDTGALTVESIARNVPPNSPAKGESGLQWLVTFSEPVENVDATDFVLDGTTATLSVVPLTISGGTIFNVTAMGGDLAEINGTVTLLFDANQDITDENGNELGNTTPTDKNENNYVIDNIAPTVMSIERQSPTSAATNADELVWRITFSEEILAGSLQPRYFALDGTNASITSVQAVSGETGVWDITASGADLAALNATVTLSFATDQSISDPALNRLENTTPTGIRNDTFVLDNTAPSVNWTPPMSIVVGKFTQILPSTTDTDIAGYSATGLPDGLEIGAQSGRIFGTATGMSAESTVMVTVTDNADNTAEFTLILPPVVVDDTEPTVLSIVRQDPTTSPTNENLRLTWLVTFSEAVEEVDVADFRVNGTVELNSITRITGGLSYLVNLVRPDLLGLSGTLRLGFADDQNIQDRAGNRFTNTTPTEANEEYVFDNIAPTVTIMGVPDTSTAPFTATITFSEPVTGFEQTDIAVTNATLSAFAESTMDGVTPGTVWTVLVTPTVTGEVTLDIAANVAEDLAGNGNTAATQATSTVEPLTVSLSGPSTVVVEGEVLTYTLTLDAAAPAGGLPVTVRVSETGDVVVGSAEGEQSVTIAAGDTQAEFTVATDDDGDDEADSDVTVTIVADNATPATYSVGTPAAATVAVNDNDLPIVTVDSSGATVTEGQAVAFVLRRQGDVSVALTVAVSLADDGDFILSPPSNVTFEAGQATTTLTVATQDDAVDEDDGSVRLLVLQSSNPSIRLQNQAGQDIDQGEAEIPVLDNDTRGVTVTGSPVAVNEGSMATYTVVLDTQPTALVTITPTSSDTAAVTVSPAILTFTAANWQTAQTVTVTGVADTDTDSEAETITHTVAGGDYEGFSAPSVSVTVSEVALPVATIEAVSTGVTEGTAVTFRVVLDTAAPSGGLPVTVSVAETGEVVAGTNEGSRMVTIAAGATQAEFTVATDDDDADEAASEVTATLVPDSADPVTYALGTADTATVTVNDNDLPIITFDTASRTITEGQNITLQLQRQGDLSVALTVALAVTDSGGFISGTAPSSVLFEAGQATASLAVATEDDEVDEDDGSVLVQVFGTSNPLIRLQSQGQSASQLTLDITVNDNDTRGVTVAGSPVAVNEGSSATYTMVLDSQPTADVTITPASSDTAAVTVSPSTLTFTTANWQTAQTVTVTGVADTDMDNEAETISHTVTGGDYGSVTVADVAVTVTDTTMVADTTDPTLVISGDPGSNDTPFMVTFAFSEPVSGFVVGDITVDNGTASDFMGDDGAMTYTAIITPTAIGEVTVSVAANAAQDGADNGNVAAMSTFTVVGTPEIEVVGLSDTVIADGTNRPSADSGTDFGPVPIIDENGMSGSLERSFTINNLGMADLVLSRDIVLERPSSSLVPSWFSITEQPARTIAAGESSTFTVRFAPTSPPSAASIWVSIASDDADEGIYDFRIGGRPVEPFMSLATDGVDLPDGGAVDFGELTVDETSAERVITIRNTASGAFADTLVLGADSVTISGPDAGEFTISTAPAVTSVAAGEETTFTIRYTPTGTGPAEATVTVNAVNGSPKDFTLSGQKDYGIPAVTLELSQTRIEEAETVDIRARLDVPSLAETRITISAVSERTPPFDINLSSDNVLVIPVGATESTNTVVLQEDSSNFVDDGQRTVSVSGSATNDRGVTGPDPVILTIDDNDIETIAPTVLSIVRQDPTASPTNADSLTWRITFSEDVVNVDAADFMVSGTTAMPVVAEVTAATVFDVTASGGDLASLDGTVTLGIASGQDITDTASTPNALTDLVPSGASEVSYELDNTAPSILSVTRQSPETELTNADSLTWRVTFSEAVVNVDPADFDVTSSGETISVREVTGETGVWDVTTSGGTLDEQSDANIVALRLRVTLDIEDVAGNALPDSVNALSQFRYDNIDPRVASITRVFGTSPTNADALTWRVAFSEPVSGVEAADFTVSGTTGTLGVSAPDDGDLQTTWDVTVSGGNLDADDFNATVTLGFASAPGIEDEAGNVLIVTTPTGTNDNSYEVDNTAPTVTIGDVPSTSTALFTATITFSESVTGFAQTDIVVTNATLSNFTETTTGRVWTVDVTPTASGQVTLNIGSGVAVDAAGNGNDGGHASPVHL